jgi:hypothetical protein
LRFKLGVLLSLFSLLGMSACPGGTHRVDGTAPAIAVQPANQTVTAPATATFTVSSTGTPPLTYAWQSAPSGSSSFTAIAGAANSNSYTTPATASGQSGAQFRVVISNGVNPPATSDPATLTVNPVVASNVTVLTYHNDNARTGQNLSETTLTPSNVNSTNFGLLGSISVDGPVDAEPLYVGNLTINGGTHNALFVVTENDSVYAFDADSFGLLWQKSMVGANETPSDQVNNCDQVTPTIGITSTPVIDLFAGAHGTIFLVAMTKDSGGNYHQRLHALDITTGAERADISSPTTIQRTASGQTFNPRQYEERAGLLLLNGAIYVAWTSHCDVGQYNAWVMGYSEATLQQASIINLTPNGGGGGIWMAGAGLAADSGGNIYFLDGNGTFDSTQGALQANGDYGNAFIKLSISGGVLSVADFFATHDTVQNSNQDLDLGSGGALVLPDLRDNSGTTWHLAVGAGKKDSSNGNAIIFVVNRDSMGKFSSTNDSAVYQELITTNTNTALEGGTGVFAMPAYFNNNVYYGAVDDNLKAFSISNAKLVSPAGAQSSSSFAYPGTTPSVSANGSSGGIVWAVENAGGGVLHAFDAADLSNELYNSNQAGNRDHFADNKFVTPMIASGKVYVGTRSSVAVFGLLSPSVRLRKPRSPNLRQHGVPAYVAPHPGSSTPGE